MKNIFKLILVLWGAFILFLTIPFIFNHVGGFTTLFFIMFVASVLIYFAYTPIERLVKKILNTDDNTNTNNNEQTENKDKEIKGN